MKPIILTAAAAAAALIAAAVTPAVASAQSVEIKNAVARVVVIVEDRSDVGVEIEPGGAGLPALEVRRFGKRVVVDGGLRRNVRSCRSGPAYARQPGEGASVEVRGHGRVNMPEAPLVVIRSPREVEVSAGSAVFGSLGPGATSIDLAAGGCGDWTVANTTGMMELNIGGSGTIRAGTSSRLEANVGGSGDVLAGATGRLEANVGGSGSIIVMRVDGDTDLSIGGSGDISIRGGRSDTLSAAIGGSGDIDFRGEAGDVEVAIAGSGDVRIRRATGEVSRAIVGSGDIIIGR